MNPVLDPPMHAPGRAGSGILSNVDVGTMQSHAAGSDQQAAKRAGSRVLNVVIAVIGLIVALLAYAIVNFVVTQFAS